MKNIQLSKKTSLFMAISICVLLTMHSCAPSYYVPANEMITTLEDKGDVEASASLGGNPLSILLPATSIGGNVRMGYAPTDKIGVMADLFYFGELVNDTRHAESSLGVGLNHGIDSTLFFRSYLIYTRGSLSWKDYFDEKNHSYRAKSSAWTIQPSITKNFERVQLTLGMNVKRIDYFSITDGEEGSRYRDDLADNSTSILIEPSLHFAIGKKDRPKFYMQFDRSVNLTNPAFNEGRNAYMSMGIKFDFNMLESGDK